LRPARRLIVAVLGLVLLDQGVPAVLQRAERHRYEETQSFRFQPSDLFGLGPLVSYLREHPRGERPRTVFLGNSILFGLDLSADDAVPGQFQRLHPETQVFNAAINGFELGSNALVAAAMVDSVDRFYVMRGPAAKNPLLASLIPVGEYEDLPPLNVLESRLQRAASVWRLYALSYRLQAALFGTSTRQFLHRYVSLAAATAHPSQDGAITVTRSRSPSPPPPRGAPNCSSRIRRCGGWQSSWPAARNGPSCCRSASPHRARSGRRRSPSSTPPLRPTWKSSR
jgi:hypothetical protein